MAASGEKKVPTLIVALQTRRAMEIQSREILMHISEHTEGERMSFIVRIWIFFHRENVDYSIVDDSIVVSIVDVLLLSKKTAALYNISGEQSPAPDTVAY